MLGKTPPTAGVVVLRNRLLHARADLPRETRPPRPRRWTFKVSQELPEYVGPYVTIFVGRSWKYHTNFAGVVTSNGIRSCACQCSSCPSPYTHTCLFYFGGRKSFRRRTLWVALGILCRLSSIALLYLSRTRFLKLISAVRV